MNSSSTHSIILTDDNLEDKEIFNSLDWNKDEELFNFFDWNNFVVSSPEIKIKYLAAVLDNYFSDIIGKDLSRKMIFHLLDTDINVNIEQDSSFPIRWSIDHQSMPILPLNFNGKGINLEFFNDYKNLILNPKLKILGGNDNNDEPHPLLNKYSIFNLPLYYEQANIIARKDPLYGYWVIFSRDNGTKTRFFMDIDEHNEITCSSIPELVDISITDYCDSNCQFCYRDSSLKGRHAELNYIKSLSYMLYENEVFEVALGGGEPTSHPYFIDILKTFNTKNITVNFTTRNVEWLKNDIYRNKVLSEIGGFAYSVKNEYDVRIFGFLVNKYDIPKHKVSIQIVEGTIIEKTFQNILKECVYHGLGIVILGFKTTGRGMKYLESNNKKFDFNYLDILMNFNKKNNLIRVGIDTVFATKYQNDLKENKIDKELYTLEEGKFSCFIDATKKQIGPSSFMPDKMIKLESTLDDFFLNTYKTF